MSRYRNDRDDDFYGGEARRRDYYEDERYGQSRGGYERGYGRGDDDDERTVVRGGGVPLRPRDAGARGVYDDYEDRGRRDYYREDYYADRRGRDYDERDERRGDDDERRGEGRSLLDEARDFVRGRRGRSGGGRGAGGGGRATRSHVRCRDIMTRDVTVARRETTLEGVAKMMRDEDTGVIPVVELPETLTNLDEVKPEVNRLQSNVVGGGRLVGIITDRDIVVRALAEGKDPRVLRAEEIMTTDIHTAHPNDRVIDAIRKMGDKQVRRIPVVDRDGTLRGIISMADVALETHEDRELAEALEEISSGATFWNRIFG
ncbi:MAG TPA: CBS domain-containing protein [Pyrinomonadaceae bacterium]|nr:CBS domain-containing protein [Pyrinomonadaceae bacterium]